MLVDKNFINQINDALSSKNFFAYEQKIIEYIKQDALKSNLKISWSSETLENERYFYRYDLLGFDNVSFKKICIEIKTNMSRKSILMTVNQFRKIRSNIIGDSIYIFVYFNDKSMSVEYIDITEMVNSDEVDIANGITEAIKHGYSSIKNILNHTNIFENSDKENIIEKDDSRNYIWPILKIVAPLIGFVFLLIIFVLDAIGVYVLNYERLILIGIIECVCLICFIKEINFKGFGIKTIMAKDKPTNKDKVIE